MHISPGAAAPASPAFAGHDAFAQPAPRSHESCGLRAARVIFLNQPIVIIHEKGPCVDGLSPVPFCGRRSLRRPQISPLNATGTRENGFRHSYTRRGCRLVHHGAVAIAPPPMIMPYSAPSANATSLSGPLQKDGISYTLIR